MFGWFDVGPIGARMVGPIGFVSSWGLDRYGSPIPDEVLVRALERARREPSEDYVYSDDEDGQVSSDDLAGTAAGSDGSSGGNGSTELSRAPKSATRVFFRYDASVRVQVVSQMLLQRLPCVQGPGDFRCNFGNVTLFDLKAPGEDLLEQQLKEVWRAASERDERRDEILAQVDATPAFFASLAGLRPDRHPRTLETMAVLATVVSSIVQRAKHTLAVPRPADLDAHHLKGPRLRPMIATPGHLSMPSGHAAFSFSQAFWLAWLWKVAGANGAQNLAKRAGDLARRIAMNRVVAGLHYPIDSRAGAVSGLMIGGAVALMADPSSSNSIQATIGEMKLDPGIAWDVDQESDEAIEEWRDLFKAAVAEWER